MKVQVDDKTYQIEFAYGTEHRDGRTSEWTQCLIRDATGWERPVAAQPPVEAVGEVRRHHKDQPNREVARKRALAKALDDLYPNSLDHPIEKRAYRKLFWDAYLNRKRQAAVLATAGARGIRP